MDYKKILTKYYFALISVIILPVVIYSYLTVVFNDDTHIFFGVARLADAMGSFPANVDIAWSTHPIGLRMVYYILYKPLQFVYGNEFLLQVLSKGTIGMTILLVSVYFAIQVKRKSPVISIYATFLITAISFFTLHIFFLMEAEFFAVILSVLAIALLLSDSRKANTIAGFVIVAVILMKLVTVVFVPAIIAAWILITGYYKSEKLCYCLMGLEIAGGLFVVSCVLWFKNVVPDTLLMLGLHDPSIHTLESRAYMMVVQSLSVNWFMPVLFVGVVTGALVFYDLLKYNTKFQQALFILMWVSPVTLVFIQSEFFLYHYMGLIIPSIVSILMFMSVNYPKHQELLFTGMILFTLLIFGTTCSVWTDTHEHIWDKMINDSRAVNSEFKLDQQPSVLYLDTGITAYLTGVPSACRYTYPLVIRRGYALNLTGSESYIKAKQCIMDYNGEYLFSLNGEMSDPDINNKITMEYTKVHSGTRWGQTESTADLYRRNSQGNAVTDFFGLRGGVVYRWN